MDTVTLQIPIDKKIRDAAADVASDYGFSSLQELTRLLLNKVAKKHLVINVEDTVVQLSRKNAKRYDKMVKEIETGKVKPIIAHNLKEHFKQLGI